MTVLSTAMCAAPPSCSPPPFRSPLRISRPRDISQIYSHHNTAIYTAVKRLHTTAAESVQTVFHILEISSLPPCLRLIDRRTIVSSSPISSLIRNTSNAHTVHTTTSISLSSTPASVFISTSNPPPRLRTPTPLLHPQTSTILPQ